MTKDLNKGITKIEYNSLNLPKLMDIKSPLAEARKEYTYTASGAKLRVVSKWNPNFSTNPVIGSDVVPTTLTKTKTTDYVGNIVYEDNALKRILVDGGYIEGGVYNFYLTDHLGNNRAVAKADASIIQRTQFYPFGAAFADGLSAGLQPYKYNGKELDAEHGVNWYDYAARQKSDFGFTSVDPHAENYYSWSPYAYVGNNPLNAIDPTGMDWFTNRENGNMIFVKGAQDLTALSKEALEAYDLGDLGQYDNLGADDMFGDKVGWGDEANLLDNGFANMAEDSEAFMNKQDYTKAISSQTEVVSETRRSFAEKKPVSISEGKNIESQTETYTYVPKSHTEITTKYEHTSLGKKPVHPAGNYFLDEHKNI